jgi:2-polyprenyl-6-hydroxyphenyl methylase/3-demethylubiquinone-9 3-methyltransferase
MPARKKNKNVDQNVDQAEIAKFEAMAHHWWDTRGDFKALHDINDLRLTYIRSHAEIVHKEVLDVGCGGGILSEGLARLNSNVTGIDMGHTALCAAKYHMGKSELHINYQKMSAEALAQKETNRFDVITCLELLEHVPNPSSVIMACSKLTKPGGNLFFATINRNIKSFIFAIIGAEYLLRLVPKGTHTFRRFIKPLEMNAWAINAGLLLKDTVGLHYNPFTRNYTIGGNVHVNYMMHFKKEE